VTLTAWLVAWGAASIGFGLGFILGRRMRPQLGTEPPPETEQREPPGDPLRPDPDAIAQAARDLWNGLTDEQRTKVEKAWDAGRAALEEREGSTR
jgi:hypothetical protein